MKRPIQPSTRTAFHLACLAAIVTAVWFAFPRFTERSVSDHARTAVADAIVHNPDPIPVAGKDVESHDPMDRSNPQAHHADAPAHSPMTVANAMPKRSWERDFFTSRSHATAGTTIQFELTGGMVAAGTIRHAEHADGELVYVSGELSAPEQGRFFFQKQTFPGKQGDFAGVVELVQSKRAWRVEPSGPNGTSELVERRLDDVICLLPPPSAEVLAAEAQEIPPLDPSDVPGSVPPYNDGIISLQSLPGATGVLYIDYRGGYTPTWGGITYDRPGVSNAQIKDVWKRVAEDYMPFNINVTTDIKVYEAAPQGRRQRCICTNTTTAAPGAGGVSYLDSWNWGGDTPNWSFYTTGKSAAEVVSHECGHALNLGHDGRNPSEGYFGGHGGGSVGWAPIMGVGYYQSVTQWSKGEYNNANNLQNDLVTITNNNAVDYRADDTGDALATARYLEVYADQTAFAEGVIETSGDSDAFRFSTNGGNVSLRVDPVSGDWANLAIMATLVDAAGNVIATHNPQSQLWASLATNLAAGNYTLEVTGAGRNDPASNGFSNYGSLGYYSVSGTVSNAVPMTYLSIAENSANGASVGTVPANNPNSNPLVYTIVSGNTGNVFAIANNGALTVSNSTPLDYETLAANTQLTVQYELFVNITNSANPALNETNRRVVVRVLDVNESPSATGFSASVYANSQPGTVVGTVTATDPDYFTSVTFAIVGGNPNNAFSINSASGVVTVSGSLPSAMAGNHVLSVQVSDGGLTTLVSANITVLAGYSGVWANAAGGSWATAANWNGGVVAGGVGETANFSTLDLTANRIVTLDGNRMIGTLLFADTTPNATWTINPGSGGTLTLNAIGTPTVTVNNQTTTIGAALEGSRGLTKNGLGTLTLTGENTYTGATSIDAGKLVSKAPSNADWTLPSGVTIASGAVETIDFTAQTTQYRKTSLGTNVINTGGLLELTGTNNDVNDWYLISSWAASGGGTIRVLNGAVSCWTGSTNALAGFTGLIDIQGGQFSSNVSGSTVLGGSFDVNIGSGGKLDLRSGNFTMDALTGSGAVIKSWTGDTATFTIGSNSGSGSWTGAMAGSNYNLVKTGGGTQTLSGSGITYPGTTNVNQGALMLSNATAFASAVTVNATGTFGGTGSSSAAVTVNNGATLVPGNNGIGTLSINNALTLSGTVNAEINKSAGTMDHVQGVTTLTYGGVLNVVNLSGTPALNDSFALFGATNYTGSFSAINLPALGGGLTWDLSNLPVNGSITVVNFTGVNPPATAPTGLAATAVSASQINLTWTAVADATSYGVSRDGTPVAIASGTSFSDVGLTMGTTYSYTVTAINAGGSSTASDSDSATTPFVGVMLAWDANTGSSGAQDGSGTWNNVASNWWYGSTNQSWTDGNSATFGVNTASNCTVTLANDVTPTAITFNATAGGTYTISGSGGINLSGGIPITSNANATLNVALKGSGALVKSGSGMLSLGAANTYGGTTTISQGRLQLTSNNALPGTANIVIGDTNSGATAPNLYLGNQLNPTFGTLTVAPGIAGAALHTSGWAPTISGLTTLNSPLTIKQYDGGYVHTGLQNNGRITGSGAGAGNDTLILQYSGAQNFYWQANNTVPNDFLGNIRITGAPGNMNAQGGANGPNNVVIPDSSMVTIDAGCTFRWNNFGNNAVVETFDGLAGAGNMSRNTGGGLITSLNLTLNANNPANEGDRVFTGALSDLNSLTFGGTGTQVLGGVNTYTGPTSINGGKLVVNGSLAAGSAVTVNFGGTLTGRGTVNGPASLGSGGILSAGDSTIGTLTLANTLALHDSGTVALRVRKAGATRTADKINLTGSAGLNYKGTLAITLDPGSDALVVGDKFTLFSKTSGTFAGSFATLTPATPGAGLRWSTANLTVDGSIEVVADLMVSPPVFSPDGGTYVGPLGVGVSTATSASSIRYTTDGSDPKTSGTAVTSAAPATVNIAAPASVTLKAYAFKAGFDDSTVVTANYVTYAAGSAVWTNPAGGSWPAGANWLGGGIANGYGVTARFDTLSLTSNPVVTLDSSPVVGGMTFGDTGNLYSWRLDAGSGGPLTLNAAGTPVVAVNNQTATLNTVLAGSQGLIKSGSGTLALGAINSLTGNITISQGTLAVSRHNAIPNTNVQLGDANTGANATGFKIDNGITATMSLTSLATTSYGSGHTLTLNAGSALGANVAALSCPLNLSGTVPLTIKSTNTGGHSTAQDFNGSITGTGNPGGTLALTLDGSSSALRLTWGGPSGTVVNNFTGDVIIKGSVNTQGTTYIGQTASRQNLGFLNNNVTVNPSTTWTIVWGGETVGALNGSGNIVLNNQNALNNTGLTIGNTGANGTFTGVISGGFGLRKLGTGSQILGGSNTYSGLTTISAGTLLVNGSLGNTATTVAAAGTLGGTGTLGAATTVNGTLSPGSNAVGTLTINSTVNLTNGSTYAAEITGPTTRDRLVAAGALTANGKLKLILSGYTPVANATFDLADAPSITGTPTLDPASTTLPAGLAWDLGSFTANGTVKVITTSAYESWAGAMNLVGPEHGTDQDPDKDGNSNLLEFALGGNPHSATDNGISSAKLRVVAGAPTLTLTLAVRSGASFGPGPGNSRTATIDGVTYQIEGSTNLASWTDAITEVTPALTDGVPASPPAGYEYHTFRSAGPVSSTARSFIRTKVSEVPAP